MTRAHSEQQQSRISPRTLVIASTASAIAAYLVAQLWAPGTLIGAAVTPVIVAVVSELLRKPIEAVPSPSAALAPLKGSGGASEDARPEAPAAAERTPPDEPRASGPPEAGAPPPAAPPAAADAPLVREYRRTDYSTYDRNRVRIVLVTAALAFAIAVAFYALADLTTGSPITGRDGSSSLFDRGGSKHGKDEDRPATTPTTPTQTQTQQQPATTPTTPSTAPDATQTSPAPAPGSRTPAQPQTEPAPAPPPTTTPPAAPDSREASPPATTTP